VAQQHSAGSLRHACDSTKAFFRSDKTYNDGRAVAESRFLGTRRRDAYVVEAIGAEVLEIVDGKIKEIHDDHTRVSPAVADSASVADAVHSP